MKTSRWILSAIGTALLSGGLVTGCAGANTTTAPASQKAINVTTEPNTNTAATNSATNSSNNNSTQPTNTGTTTTTPSTPASSTAPSDSTALETVRQASDLAKSGQAVGVPFKVQSNIEAVSSAWGQPAQQSSAGAGIYATFPAHQAAFGLNKGEQIFDVRSSSSAVQSVTLADIEQVLGQPGTVRHTSDSQIYLYPAGPDYQLMWVFAKSNGSVASHVDHISVFWPQGTVNSMAQTQPAPGVVIDKAPGEAGQLFTFSIANPPKGYQLEELEWIPTSGSAVINTLTQASNNGTNGNSVPGFTINRDGQTLSFRYTDAMRGQTGYVRVIYQDTSGAAMLGQSSTITLK
ncbi:YjgB family protein [Alicyclobacillus fastidiosus]|uniref:YjgB family protein n=1 Tax=Alicyclobacillus fastidiosus TaxID=392011 RepID=A0ABV5ANG4_9BACL|nr:YjgB family protein [Alicyclobacillus fastidiosus]WEH08219.1 YjgB family protein [Alicyclobacillus fastidiosus]